MPKYTRNGVTISSDKELNQAQLEEAFGLSSSPSPTSPPEPSAFDNLKEIGKGMADPIINTLSHPIEALKSLTLSPTLDEAVSPTGNIGRAAPYFEAMNSQDDTYGKVLMALGATMAASPLGGLLPTGEKMVMNNDPRAGGEMLSNILMTASPFGKEIPSEVSSGASKIGSAAIDAGRFASTNPIARGALVGAGTYGLTKSLPHAIEAGLLGTGRVGRIFKGVSKALEDDPITLDDIPSPKEVLGESDIKPLPTPKGSAVEDIKEFPTRYKNVRLKDLKDSTSKLGVKEVNTPQPPNPYSDAKTAPPTYDALKNTGLVSEEEARGIVKANEVKELLPTTHEEWQAVNELESLGMDRVEAMKIVKGKGNLRSEGNNPRSLGSDNRTRGVNPRSLTEKRRGL